MQFYVTNKAVKTNSKIVMYSCARSINAESYHAELRIYMYFL